MTDTDFMTREDERPWSEAPRASQPGTVSIQSASGHWMCDANPAWAHLIMGCVNDYSPERERKVEALVEAAENLVAANKAENFMRTADMHAEGCDCMRCMFDALEAKLASLKESTNG